MKNSKRFLALTIIIVSLFSLTACSFSNKEPVKPANEIVKESLQNLALISSAGYDLKADMAAEKPGTLDKLTYNFDLSGNFDLSNETYPIFTAKLVGKTTGSDPADNNDINLELRVDRLSMYGFIGSLPDLGEEVPKDMVTLFSDQWWKMPIPEGTMAKLLAELKARSVADPQTQSLKDMAKDVDFLKNLKYLGTEKIMGDSSYHYSGEIDKDALRAFLVKASELSSQKVDEKQLADYDAFMANTVFNAEIWIGKDDMTLRKFSGTTAMTPTEGGKVSFNFAVTLGNLNEKVTIEIPKDTKDFDPTALLGGLSGLAGDTGETTPAPTDEAPAKTAN